MCIPMVTCSSMRGHQISSPMASLMQDTMYKLHHHTLHYCSNSMRMYHTQSHRGVSCTCWIRAIVFFFSRFSYQYVTLDSGFNMGLNGGDHFTTSWSNSNILKFVKVLNKPRVVCIVPNMSQTLTFQLIDCLTPNSNSFVLNIPMC